MKKDNIIQKISSYLHFGYSLNYKNPGYKIDFSGIDKDKYEGLDENEAIKTGANLLQGVFHDLYNTDEEIVIPLSGGVDSRLILASLSELTELSNIYTYTFGSPGTFDYEIGNNIAKRFNTKHSNFPLTNYKYRMEELIDISRRFSYQSPLFIHPPLWKLQERYGGMEIWSGVNAGAVVGSFVAKNPSLTLDDAKKKFVQKGAFVKSINLCSESEPNFIKDMVFDPIDPELLTFDEQVSFTQRSEKHLAPNVLIKGFKYKTPFINNDFMTFMLSQEKELRFGKSLYKKIAYHAFPEFFQEGIEGNYGIKINSPKWKVNSLRKWHSLRKKVNNRFPSLSNYTSPMINYINFDSGIRERNDLREIIISSIHDLKNRKLIDWLDPEKILSNHLSCKANYADALIALASLEIHLKAGKKLRSSD